MNKKSKNVKKKHKKNKERIKSLKKKAILKRKTK
jgi:hypothetical protein